VAAIRRYPALVVVLLLLGALVVGAVSAEIILARQNSSAPAALSNASTASAIAAQRPISAAAIYQQALPGVVTITTQSGSLRGRGQGTGSGIVLNRNGDILTNAHVVSGASQLQVTFHDGTTANASVSRTDPAHDLAVIRVSVKGSSLHPLTLGNSDTVLVGDTAYAIGAPFGYPESMVAGVISGLNRTDDASGLHDLIQTDAPTNPGNSGGPLLNTLGQVIGINVAIDSPVQGSVGVGFAVPINVAKQLVGSSESGAGI
jgi:putative serine protease PepD